MGLALIAMFPTIIKNKQIICKVRPTFNLNERGGKLQHIPEIKDALLVWSKQANSLKHTQ